MTTKGQKCLGLVVCCGLVLAACGQSDVGRIEPGSATPTGPAEEIGTTTQALNSINV